MGFKVEVVQSKNAIELRNNLNQALATLYTKGKSDVSIDTVFDGEEFITVIFYNG